MANNFSARATGLDCDLSLVEYFEKHGSEIAKVRNWKYDNNSGTYKTLEVYTGYLEDLSRHLPDKSISTMTYVDFQRGIEKVKVDNSSGKEYKDSTLKSFRSLLNDIYGYAQNRNDANTKPEGINCEFDDYQASSALRRRMGKVIKNRMNPKK